MRMHLPIEKNIHCIIGHFFIIIGICCHFIADSHPIKLIYHIRARSNNIIHEILCVLHIHNSHNRVCQLSPANHCKVYL